MAPEDLPKRALPSPVATSASESIPDTTRETRSASSASTPAPTHPVSPDLDPSARSALAATRGHLPRLSPPHYQSLAAVFWTYTIDRRATGWLTEAFHQHWRFTLLHACARYRLVCPAYVLMPDHVHLLWLGCAADSDQRLAAAFLRKNTSAALAPARWQHQAYDHVLRPEERERNAFAATAHYILENPVLARLVADRTAYPYMGCIIPGYPELTLHTADYWERFWRVHAYLLDKSDPARPRS